MDGLDVSVSENDGYPRDAILTVSFAGGAQASGAIVYAISQSSDADRLQALKYEADFKYFQSIGAERKLSSITPMGTHFEKFQAATETQKAWLSTASNEPMNLPAHPEWPYKSFPNITLYPYGHPSPADVNQHEIGDCCFLAVLADFAYMYPGFIEDIIPSWSTVMEKALLKWETVFGVDKLGGIGPGAAVAPFTGNGDGFGFAHNVLSAEDLVRAVEAGLYKRHFISVGFKYADYMVGTAKTVTSHCYSVFYTPVNGAMFTMRNPWGFCTGGTPPAAPGLPIPLRSIPPSAGRVETRLVSYLCFN